MMMVGRDIYKEWVMGWLWLGGDSGGLEESGLGGWVEKGAIWPIGGEGGGVGNIWVA